MDCKHARTVWTTRTLRRGPTDVKSCADCGRPLAMAPMELPLEPFEPGACPCCGGAYAQAEGLQLRAIRPGEPLDTGRRCERCGRSPGEALLRHAGLLAWVERHGPPTERNFVAAAEAAHEMGRSALALKLATAGLAWQHGDPAARGLRIDLLRRLGRREAAEVEARRWHAEEDAPAWVASVLVSLLFDRGANAEALSVLDQALERHPSDLVLRIERAELLEELGHWEAACADAVHGLGALEEVHGAARGILVRCLERLLALDRPQAVIERIDAGGRAAHMDPELSWLRSCALLELDDRVEARRWLVHTLDLAPDNDEARHRLEGLEREMGIARLSHLYRAS